MVTAKGKSKVGLTDDQPRRSANMNMRKALADVSNVQGNSERDIRRDASKIKVLAGSCTVGDVTSRKSFAGRLQRNISQGDIQLGASKRVTTNFIAPLGDQRINKNAGRSSVVTEDRTAKKSLLPSTTRKSLPVPRRVSREDMSNTKDNNARSAETARKLSGIPTKATTGRKVASQLISARSYLRRTRVSDGCVQMSLETVFAKFMKQNTGQRTV
ncbi:putative cyclin-B3-1 isoform X1 [Senna tora]|uniref:Putative cyclin-B3-1 isoform X1 n=1 Tax=Senna tora TaxID=362788 RepID=A0A834WIU8_9FABA|nr:putative cyclin-B3-1 isoform X1 [Senna tora]